MGLSIAEIARTIPPIVPRFSFFSRCPFIEVEHLVRQIERLSGTQIKVHSVASFHFLNLNSVARAVFATEYHKRHFAAVRWHYVIVFDFVPLAHRRIIAVLSSHA